MCSNLKYHHRNVGVGTHLVTMGKNGYDYKLFGIGDVHNGRLEKLDTVWKNYDKVYTECDGFYEGRAYFELNQHQLMYLACVQNEQGVVILTRGSLDTIVQPFHARVPVILLLPNYYIEGGVVKMIDYTLLRHIS